VAYLFAEGCCDEMIDWSGMDPATFERGMQAYLKKRYPGLCSYDGSGGDGGKDARLITAAGDHIFEVKSFSQPLSSSRRKKIERSLTNAARSTPGMVRWTLVIPRNKTPDRGDGRNSEERWFDTTLQWCAPGVELEWFGLDQLDAVAAENR
jgi:hypothetical protein